MIRTSVLATGALLLATSSLAGCGFNYATDRPYTPANGVDDKSGTVDVLSAMVVSSRPGEGTFIAGLSNSSTTTTISLNSLAPAAGKDYKPETFTPYKVRPMGYVNLAAVDGITLTGLFTAGDFVSVVVGFDDGEMESMDVPVVTACDEYAGLDLYSASPSVPAAGGSGAASPTAGASTQTLPPPPPPAFTCDDPGGTDPASSTGSPSQ